MLTRECLSMRDKDEEGGEGEVEDILILIPEETKNHEALTIRCQDEGIDPISPLATLLPLICTFSQVTCQSTSHPQVH